MITSLKPYPAMKDSGVEWLGEVPEHWHNRKLRSVLSNVTDRNRPDLPLLSVLREKGVIIRNVSGRDENHNYIPDDLTNYKVVREGQFAMNKMKAWQGSYGVSIYDGIVSPAYFVFDLKDVAGDFFNVAIRSIAYVPFFTHASDGVRIGQWDLSQSRMREIPFSVPSPDEQSAIVRYLNYVDRRVRRLVRAKRKLIALFNEQKQAIIHRAVTRGLNPDVPMQDSGVEWLGEVPEHWAILQVRRLVSFITSGSRGWAEFYSDSGDIFLQSGNLGRTMSLDFSHIQRVKLPGSSEGIRTRVRKNDILLCITGALTGNTVHVDEDVIEAAYVNQHVALIRPIHQRIFPRFLAYCLHSPIGQSQLKTSEYGGTKQGLGLEDVHQIWVPVPSERHQKAVVEFLDTALAQLHGCIEVTLSEIDLLNEYRTRLIADVVTGKVDVREAAAVLPEVDPLATEVDSDDTLDTDTEADLDEMDAILEENEP